LYCASFHSRVFLFVAPCDIAFAADDPADISDGIADANFAAVAAFATDAPIAANAIGSGMFLFFLCF
jgi:hypothetical protein